MLPGGFLWAKERKRGINFKRQEKNVRRKEMHKGMSTTVLDKLEGKGKSDATSVLFWGLSSR